MSTDNLEGLLERLERIWAQDDVRLIRRLAPGLSPEETAARLAHLELDPPRELITWFGWHNATDLSEAGRQWIGAAPFAFLSLDQAVELCTSLREAAAELAQETGWTEAQAGWSRSWFPIFAGGSPSYAAIDCGITPSSGSSPIRHIGHADEHPERVDAASLSQVISWWLDMHASGAYFWDGTAWRSNWESIPEELRRTGLV